MKIYKLKFVETLEREVEIEAEDLTAAISKGWDLYDDGTIVLDASHHVNTDIQIEGED